MEQPEIPQEDESLHMAALDQELEDVLVAGHSLAMPLAWENSVRSLFLLVVVGVLGFFAYQPTKLRLSMLLSLASPSHGDSLEWTPMTQPLPPTPEIKRTPSPDEWRLSPGYSASWNSGKNATKFASGISGSVVRDNWPRFSSNSWSWQDDAAAKRTALDPEITPPQKSATAFRANEHEVWPDTAPAPVQTPAVAVAVTPAANTGTTLPPLSAPLPSQTNGAAVGLPATLPSLPGTTTSPAAGQSGLPPLGALSPLAAAGTAPATPETRPQTTAPAEQGVDWKNTEITGPIAGAYLTIYPKLKFVGLCIPGQGYIRKYNQIGVPSDLVGPKMAARDGKAPYGRYYIADRHRDADGSRLYLSWPSPEDAQRIGLDAGRIAQITNAWRRQELPPQDTAAGGGIGLNGLRNWVEVTEGGFSLEEPHMEEIFTALPDKAWVFVQE